MALTPSSIPMGRVSGSDATEKLEKTIIDINQTATRQTNKIIKLTYAILALTFVMAVLVVVQIWITINSQSSKQSAVQYPIDTVIPNFSPNKSSPSQPSLNEKNFLSVPGKPSEKG